MATTIDWPTTLPEYPRPGGYRESPPNTAFHADRDLGPPQSYRLALEGMRPFTCVYEMSRAQMATFDTFYTAQGTAGIGGGTLSFNTTHPRTGVSIEVKILDPPEYGCSGGDNWTITLRMSELAA